MAARAAPLRPLQPSTVAALAALLGGVLALLSLKAIGWSIGSMARDSLGTWSDDGWGAVLWLLLGAGGAALSRRSANGLAFWAAWAGLSLAMAALAGESLLAAGIAALLPFTLLARPAAAALRLVGGLFGVFVLMVAAAVATDRLGAYGTVAGLGWALLSSAYFMLWALRDAGRASAVAWTLSVAWSSACLAVAIGDAIRFHDVQAWVVLGVTAAADAGLATAWAWRVRAAADRGSGRAAYAKLV